jgi:hypothetical protein
MSGLTLERRLANFRAATRDLEPKPPDHDRSHRLAETMAEALDGEIVRNERGVVVRCEPMTVVLPIDRDRLSSLPGQPPPGVPLVCLDTETTGLATAAGTMAFLIGLGWWEGDRFRQAQLLLPDQPEEPALLALLRDHIPADGWLVTYNGRGFDWPLLVTRYRMARHEPPAHAGHLDLLPFVRRVYRHRMTNARLQTVESELLGLVRHEDVGGWEIPGRYLDFLRLGVVDPLVEVVRHNREDVRSLARLLAHVDVGFGDAVARRSAHRGDLAGLARAFSRERRLDEALDCLDTAVALERPRAIVASGAPALAATGPKPPPGPDADDAWWAPGRPVDFGGRHLRTAATAEPPPLRLDSPWTEERIVIERARVLRRLGRYADAAAAWEALAAGIGPFAPLAWVEVAKLREHRLADVEGALVAVDRAASVVARRRALGRPDPRMERQLAHRRGRLIGRLAAAAARAGPPVRSLRDEPVVASRSVSRPSSRDARHPSLA